MNYKTLKGGSISSNKSVSFEASASGEIKGLNISLGGSVSNELGYVLDVGPNKRCYMGYRVKYNIEKGTRVRIHRVTGKVVSTNTYTIKKPAYGEYKLINY